MTALIARIVRCGAVMTSALVSLSAQIVPVPPASETVAAEAALVGAGAVPAGAPPGRRAARRCRGS